MPPLFSLDLNRTQGTKIQVSFKEKNLRAHLCRITTFGGNLLIFNTLLIILKLAANLDGYNGLEGLFLLMQRP